MEPATPQETTVTPSPGTRQNRTLQAILLFSLLILVVFILAVLTGAFGGKNTVTSAQATATASAQANLGIFSGGNGSSVLSGTITAGSPTAISLTPGTGQATDSALSGSNGTSNGGSNGGTTDGSNGGSTTNGSASGDQSGNGSLPGGTNSNPSGASGDATGGTNGSTTGGSTGGSNGGVAGTGNSGLAGSLPGGTNSNPSSGTSGTNGGNSASGNGTASGTNSSLPGGTNGSTTGGSTGSSTGGQSGSNSSASNLPSPHLGNYVCTTGPSGNLIYQSDFTILEGLKYKHSSNPTQEFSFTYDPNSRMVTWLDGPNAGTVGTFYLPDGADTYKIVEKFPDNPQAAPVSCMLAEK